MWAYVSFFLVIFAIYITAEQYRYIFEHEKFDVDYFDKNSVDVTGKLYDVNQTKALNVTFTLKVVLPDDAVLYGSAMKWIKNHYGPPLIQVSKTIKNALDMTLFDIDKLILTTFRPPLAWPIEKGVTYHTFGWIPDVTKFPPNLPAGKWKIPVSFMYANKTTFAEISWYLKIVYKH